WARASWSVMATRYWRSLQGIQRSRDVSCSAHMSKNWHRLSERCPHRTVRDFGFSSSWCTRRRKNRRGIAVSNTPKTAGPAAAGAFITFTHNGGTGLYDASTNTFCVESTFNEFHGDVSLENGSLPWSLNGRNDTERFHIGDPQVRLEVGGTYELNPYPQI
ncbi:MAG: hypothetical protein ABWX63_06935, partial [Paeniglutamicibacter terrestris]